jgi:hypothetical protein
MKLFIYTFSILYLVLVSLVCGGLLVVDFYETFHITPTKSIVFSVLAVFVYFFVLYLMVQRVFHYLKNKKQFLIYPSLIKSKISHFLGILLLATGIVSVTMDFSINVYVFFNGTNLKDLDWTFVGYSLKYFVFGIGLFEFGRYIQLEYNKKSNNQTLNTDRGKRGSGLTNGYFR